MMMANLTHPNFRVYYYPGSFDSDSPLVTIEINDDPNKVQGSIEPDINKSCIHGEVLHRNNVSNKTFVTLS